MIQIENASKAFNGNYAIKDLSLKINSGEILGLLGANGAGKTTSINLLLGFIKPDNGEVLVNQLDASANPAEVRKLIGYIPENVNLYPYLTGLENLDYFCRLAGLKYSETELSGFLSGCGLNGELLMQRKQKFIYWMNLPADLTLWQVMSYQSCLKSWPWKEPQF